MFIDLNSLDDFDLLSAIYFLNHLGCSHKLPCCTCQYFKICKLLRNISSECEKFLKERGIEL